MAQDCAIVTVLAVVSQVMADKIVSGPKASIVRAVGTCDGDEMFAVDHALRGCGRSPSG